MTTIEHAQKRLQLIETRNKQIAKLKELRASLRRQKEMIARDTEDLKRIRETHAATLKAARLEFEATVIRKALEAAGGSVTDAAPILGMSYQGLGYILENRHKALAPARTPIRRRSKKVDRRERFC